MSLINGVITMMLKLNTGIRGQLKAAPTVKVLEQLSADIDECTKEGVLKDVPAQTRDRWNTAIARTRVRLTAETEATAIEARKEAKKNAKNK